MYLGKSDILRFDTLYIGNIKGNFHCPNIIFIKANIPVHVHLVLIIKWNLVVLICNPVIMV